MLYFPNIQILLKSIMNSFKHDVGYKSCCYIAPGIGDEFQ